MYTIYLHTSQPPVLSNKMLHYDAQRTATILNANYSQITNHETGQD